MTVVGMVVVLVTVSIGLCLPTAAGMSLSAVMMFMAVVVIRFILRQKLLPTMFTAKIKRLTFALST